MAFRGKWTKLLTKNSKSSFEYTQADQIQQKFEQKIKMCKYTV
jgi:hypothetical protein